MQRFLTLILPAALCATFAGAQTTTATSCTASNSSITGAYGYTANELGLSGTAINPPGTNSQVYSNTPTGILVGSINGGNTFAQAGVLYFDGSGNITTATSSSVGGQTHIGTYTVNNDCTITVTLTDVFNTTSTTPGVTIATQGATKLIGLVLGGGTEIILSAPQSTTSTNGNTPLVTGAFASRLTVQLIRALPFGCSVSSLTGAYGLIGNGYFFTNSSTTTGTGTTGTTTTTTGTEQPATFFARVDFNGNGTLTADTVTATSPLGSFQMTGTYTVNQDCSGTMTLTMPSTTSTTGTTTGTGTTGTGTTTTSTTTNSSTSITASFVLTPPAEYPINGTVFSTGYSVRPGIEFTLNSAAAAISGFGIAQ